MRAKYITHILSHTLYYLADSGSSSSSTSKRPRLDQIPAANLDADDPLDDEVSFLSILHILQWC